MKPHLLLQKPVLRHLFVYFFVIAANYCQAQTLTNVNNLKGKVTTAGLTLREGEAVKLRSQFKNPATAPRGDTSAVSGSIMNWIASEKQNWQESARYARDHATDFANMLSASKDYPSLINFSPKDQKPKRYIAYAVLASQDESEIDQYFKENDIKSPKDIEDIKSEIAALRKAIDQTSNPTIAIFATGDVRGVATGSSEGTSSTGTGTLGFTYAGRNTIYTIKIAVASTLDTLKSNYGASLLSPTNGNPLKSGLFEVFQRIGGFEKSWAHLYVTGSGNNWQISQDPETKVTTTKNASILGGGLLYRHQVIDGLIANTPVSGGFEIGVSGRWLGGDVRNLLMNDTGTDQYLKIFPTKKSSFIGLEGGFSVSFGQITAAFQSYYYFKKGGEPIDGLTGLQITGGISIRADIINDIFKSK